MSGENLEVVNSENVVVTAREKNITPSFESVAAAILTKQNSAESFITLVTPLYTATLTNKSGGSFTNYILSSENSDELKHQSSTIRKKIFEKTKDRILKRMLKYKEINEGKIVE